VSASRRRRSPGDATRLIRLLAPENPGGVIYGVIVIGALLAAESGRHEGYADTLASAVLATGVYWLAHAYATLIGARLRESARLTARELARALAHDLAIVRGAAVPVAAVFVGWVAGAGIETAVTAALWCAVASVVAFELLAGVRARATRAELLLDLAVGAALGSAMILLKIVLHP
jgi:hypothetical protein